MFTKQKSSDPDFYLVHIKRSLNRIELEQVNQRKDLSVLNVLLKSLIHDLALQKQVDDYFEADETSPQTDLEDK